MKVNIKKINQSIPTLMPTKAHPTDAGFDIYATSHSYEEVNGVGMQVYGTNIAFEIPEGYFGMLVPRSSVTKTNLMLGNSLGILDSSYRGEVKFKFKIDAGVRPAAESTYKSGDRIGQLIIIPLPNITLNWATFLSDTARGQGGFGSSGV